MLKLGVIGLNDGNGHPYSYAAMFNGFDPKALQNECPYAAIKEYLPANHRNENLIDNAKVTHIWTQDRAISESVANVALVPNIVDNAEDMIGEVDALLLLRDDPENHLLLAKPFLDAGLPIYIDKALAADALDLKTFDSYARDGARIMAGSGFRFSHHVSAAVSELDIYKVRSIHGLASNTWLRYASHILDPVFRVFGSDVISVRNVGPEEGRETAHLQFESGLEMVIQCYKGIGLPMHFTCYSSYPITHYLVPLTDFNYMYRSLMVDFVRFLNTGERSYSWEDTVQVSKVVVAGEVSRKSGGVAVNPKEI